MAAVSIREPLLNRVSWGALFAGFFFGFAAWMLLLALGAGIGFTAFDARDVGQWQGFGIGFGIWGVIAAIVSFFFAAWIAARLSQADSRPAGMLHGAALWGFMLVVGLWAATMAVARTAGAAASAVGTAAQTAGQAAASNPDLQQQAQQQAQQAQGQAQQLEAQAREKAPQAAEAAKTAGAAGAWAFFIFAVLTLVAAILGGGAGVPKERMLIRREEHVPVPPGAPFSPQRA
jgi:hypothetical protein